MLATYGVCETHGVEDARPQDGIVYVIDDDSGVRESIELLGRSVRLTVKTYENAQAFLDDFDHREDAPSCLLVDVRLPGISGLELQRRLNAWKIHIPIIFVTGYAEVPMAVRAMQAGAVDFLEKPLGAQDLLDRIQTVLERERQRKRVEKHRPADVSSRLATLSQREKEVMEHLVLGKNTKQVAAVLRISPKTVAKHRASILEKMGVDSVVELLRLVGTAELYEAAS